MKRAIKILYVNGGLLDFGGVTSFMLNYYNHLEKSEIHIDFLVHGYDKGPRDSEVLKNGSQIFRVTPKFKNPLKFYLEVRKILKKGHFDIVHAHADSGNGVILKIAKQCGIKTRISHSHNTNYTINNKLRIWINNIEKSLIKKNATHFWACSNAAGEWLYGKNSQFLVIPNAIDLKKFYFNKEIREKLRKDLNLENDYVFGHIGRFDTQKNQMFLLRVFSEVSKTMQDSKLVLIGDGNDREKIESVIDELKIKDKVILLGRRNDVNDLINLFDVFLLPSLFEGLGIVNIEAQANGLQCICSDKVPIECDITGRVHFLKLEENLWIKELTKKVGRFNFINSENDYNIETASKRLARLYKESLSI